MTENETKLNDVENNDGKGFEIVFTRPNVEWGQTISDTTRLIKRLDVNDPDWFSKVSTLIKRFTHHEKFSVYHRVYTEYSSLSPDMCLFLVDKCKTHKMLYEQLSDEIDTWDLKS